jgi:hypothetical protein
MPRLTMEITWARPSAKQTCETSIQRVSPLLTRSSALLHASMPFRCLLSLFTSPSDSLLRLLYYLLIYVFKYICVIAVNTSSSRSRARTVSIVLRKVSLTYKRPPTAVTRSTSFKASNIFRFQFWLYDTPCELLGTGPCFHA